MGKTMTIDIIKYPTEEDWLLAKKCTLVTVGKETENPATVKFKKGMLRARHSPIRELKFVFYLKDVPYWVSVHLCRHVHAQPYVKTQRNKRLCNLASAETRELVKMMCKKVIEVCPEFKDELVPMCVRNGGVCYEMFPCGERKEND